MKTPNTRYPITAALAYTSAFAQEIPTTGTVESRLGPLEVKNGFPIDKTVTKLYDALDFQRACQAYIWALPYMAMTEWQRWTREEFGADKDAPVAQFWSFTVYDYESRCLIDAGSYPDRSSRDDIVKNTDGSVDLYFGPEAPAGKPSKNWGKTLPGKCWFTYFRLYGPTQPYFDRTWVLPDIELVK